MKRSGNGIWTEEADRRLVLAVQKYGAKNWNAIAKEITGSSGVQCLHRWQKVLNPEIIKGPWSKEEDDRLFELVDKQTTSKINWSNIAKSLPSRGGKQCRERWVNHLRPGIETGPWTKEEEVILITEHRNFGNKWVELAKLLPGRTENAIKNFWNSSLKNREQYCTTANTETGSRSAQEAKIDINLHHRKRKRHESPREEENRCIIDLPPRIASDGKCIAASASTFKSGDCATMSRQVDKRIDQVHSASKRSCKFIHLNKFLPPNHCPSPVRYITESGKSGMKPGPIQSPPPSRYDEVVPNFDLRSALAGLKRLASSYKNKPSIISRARTVNSLLNIFLF